MGLSTTQEIRQAEHLRVLEMTLQPGQSEHRRPKEIQQQGRQEHQRPYRIQQQGQREHQCLAWILSSDFSSCDSFSQLGMNWGRGG
jgi:hypothetical protein